MITLFSSNQRYTWADAQTALRKQIEKLPRMVSTIGNMQKILRFEYRIEPVDLLSWLHNQKTKVKLYWSTRNGEEEIAGIGCADEIVSTQEYPIVLEKMKDKLSQDSSRLRYYGGFSFSKDSVDDKWDVFGASRFFVPQFELLREGDAFYLSFHINVGDITPESIQKILIDFDALNFLQETAYRKVPEILHREDLPQKAAWKNMVETALQSSVEKTVLARRSKFQFDLKIRPNALIKFLKDLTPHCFHFCFQLDEHTGFLGATPERLFQIKEDQLLSEAIAGTASEEAVLNSSKYELEQQYVVDALKEQFEQLCTSYDYDEEPHVLKLKEAHHLQTRFTGRLKSEMEVADVLMALHPTPAVGGCPKEESVQQIKDLEPFRRGWYAAPIGRVGFDACEFLVAIRSGLVSEGDLYLYAGAGIVEGSEAKTEWDEIKQKISRFMKVFE